MNHYAGIQVLRGISVIAVILYHLYPKVFRLGYTGVDIFFVISGFVVTLSLKKLDQPMSIRLLTKFYRNRARRLLPALVICCAFFITISITVFPEEKIWEQIQHSVYSLLGLSNFFYYRMGDYFSTDSSIISFLHTWSLSVEWQFYILLPFVFLLDKNHKYLIFLTFFISIILFTLFFDSYTRFSHFMLPTRMWEFLVGTIICLYGYRLKFINIIPHYLLLLALITWLFLGDLITGGRNSVEISVSIIIASLFICRLLNKDYSKPYSLKVVGDASYSLYLYHWPIIAALNYLYVYDPFVRIAGCLMALGVGIASYYTIERRSSLRMYFAVLMMFPFAVFAFSLGEASRLKENLDFQSKFKLYRGGQCSISWNNPSVEYEGCIFGRGANYREVSTLVIGDSFAEAFTNGIEKGFPSVSGMGVFARGCFPALKINRVENDEFSCDAYYANMLELVAQLDNLSNIFVVSRLDHYLNDEHFPNNPSYTEHGIEKIKYKGSDGREASIGELADGYEEFIRVLAKKSRNVNIYIPYGFPYGTKDVMRWGYLKNLLRNPADEFGIDYSEHKTRGEHVNKLVNNINLENTTTLDASKVVCSFDRCFTFKNEHPLYFDDDHPSIFYIKEFFDYYGLINVLKIQ